MTVFRQENLEEHYETGEDLGRWVRAGRRGRAAGTVAAERGGARGEGRRSCCPPLETAPRRLSSPSAVPGGGRGGWILSRGVFAFFSAGLRGVWTLAVPHSYLL